MNAARCDGLEHVDGCEDCRTNGVADELVEVVSPQRGATADERPDDRDAAQDRQLVFAVLHVVHELSTSCHRQGFRRAERLDQVVAEHTVAVVAAEFFGATRGQDATGLDVDHRHAGAGCADVEQRDATLTGEHSGFS